MQGGLCFFARALGFGRSLPVPVSVCILVCQITPCWNSQLCNLCSCNSVQSEQVPALSSFCSSSGLLFPPHSEPQSDFPFSGEGKLLHGWQKDLPRGRGAQSEPWPWQGILQHLHSLPRRSAPGRGWCEGWSEIPSVWGDLQG